MIIYFAAHLSTGHPTFRLIKGYSPVLPNPLPKDVDSWVEGATEEDEHYYAWASVDYVEALANIEAGWVRHKTRVVPPEYSLPTAQFAI